MYILSNRPYCIDIVCYVNNQIHKATVHRDIVRLINGIYILPKNCWFRNAWKLRWGTGGNFLNFDWNRYSELDIDIVKELFKEGY